MTVRSRIVTYRSDGTPDPSKWGEFPSREAAEAFNDAYCEQMSPFLDLIELLGGKRPTFEYEDEDVVETQEV